MVWCRRPRRRQFWLKGPMSFLWDKTLLQFSPRASVWTEALWLWVSATSSSTTLAQRALVPSLCNRRAPSARWGRGPWFGFGDLVLDNFGSKGPCPFSGTGPVCNAALGPLSGQRLFGCGCRRPRRRQLWLKGLWCPVCVTTGPLLARWGRGPWFGFGDPVVDNFGDLVIIIIVP